LALGCLLANVLGCCTMRTLQLSPRSTDSSTSTLSLEEHSEDGGDDQYEPEPLDEDFYGMAVSSLVRDVRKFVLGDRIFMHFVRSAISMLVVWFSVAMQGFLIWQFERLITQVSVHKIRSAYGLFENWMYEGHITLNVHGFSHGIAGHFNKAKFTNLDQVVSKTLICNIPLSQPCMTMGILAVWSLTVVADFRKICFLVDLLLVKMPAVKTVRAILTHEDKHTVLLSGFTRGFKAMLLVLLFLPPAAIDMVLLWLGCRCLFATLGFENLLLNAVALEFILLLKEIMYKAFAPKHKMLETRHFLVPHHQVHAGWSSCLGAFGWVFITVSWIVAYVFKLQHILPDFRWDLHAVCEEYLKVLTSPTSRIPLPGYVPPIISG